MLYYMYLSNKHKVSLLICFLSCVVGLDSETCFISCAFKQQKFMRDRAQSQRSQSIGCSLMQCESKSHVHAQY